MALWQVIVLSNSLELNAERRNVEHVGGALPYERALDVAVGYALAHCTDDEAGVRADLGRAGARYCELAHCAIVLLCLDD